MEDRNASPLPKRIKVFDIQVNKKLQGRNKLFIQEEEDEVKLEKPSNEDIQFLHEEIQVNQNPTGQHQNHKFIFSSHTFHLPVPTVSNTISRFTKQTNGTRPQPQDTRN